MSDAQIDFDGKRMDIVQGDITKEEVDAIVNAANEGLRGGGGVDGAIHRAGGPDIMKACRKLGGCPTGDARPTTAGNLPADYVIHAVGPVYKDGTRGEPELLAGCYRRSMEIADEKGCESIAFPAISCGVYGYPINEAANIALNTVKEELTRSSSVKIARFVLFSADDYEAYRKALNAL